MAVKVVNEANCSGCNLCMLACSFHNSDENSFNPSEAKIKISRKDGLNRFHVKLKDDCLDCEICVGYCFYNVLSIEQ